MKQIEIKAYAKINLSLGVLGRRTDGYHELQSVMQSVDLFDTVMIQKTEGEGIRLSVYDEDGNPLTEEKSGIPWDERNIAMKAAVKWLKRVALKNTPVESFVSGYEIRLTKRIPQAAGMAGGSADAAAVLYGLNKLNGELLTEEELIHVGAAIGADVPFCLKGGTCLCEGIGEILTPVPESPAWNLLLIKPDINVSTKDIFTAIDSLPEYKNPDTGKLFSTLSSGINTDLTYISGIIGNVLENVTIPLHPVIAEIKAFCIENGALGALMSGSGPTVYAFFETPEKALFAKNTAIQKYPGFIVKTAKTCDTGLEEMTE